jgi:hypothetical protein
MMAAQSTPPTGDGIGIAMVTFLSVLFGIMMLVHFIQPAEQETTTSSPAHQQKSK